MSIVGSRVVRIATTVALALGLVAVMCVDVAVADQRRAHDRKVAAARAERRAERAYLERLRPLVVRVYRAAAPEQAVLDALADPEPTDVYAARDAFAHGRATADLAALAATLHRLAPPAALRQQTASLTKAVDDMHAAAADLGSHAGDTSFADLADALNGDSATAFGTATAAFVDAVVAAFAHRQMTPPFDTPDDGPDPGPTATSWIFGADRGCAAAYIRLLPVIKLQKQSSLAAARADIRLWSTTLLGLAKTFDRLPRPTGTASLPRALLLRLPAIRANGQVFAGQLRAIDRHDPTSYDAGVARLHELLPALGQLGRQMRAYGAVDCAIIMGGWAGDKSAGKGGVTST
jgi:hypothetical protein